MDKQLQRETIVLTVAAHLKSADPSGEHMEKLIGIDTLVCDAIGIDSEKTPPEFIIPI